MQWAYYGIWEAKENKVRRNLVRVRSLEGVGALGRLGLEGFLLFMYPNYIFSGSFDHLEGAGEVFHRVLQFPLR